MAEEKAIAASERYGRERLAFNALFDAFKEWIDVVGASPEDQKLIDEKADIVWTTSLDGRGPETELLLWLSEHPEIWRRAMPEETIIVPRKMLSKIIEALPPTTLGGSICADDFEYAGNALLEGHAHVAMRARMIDKERQPERDRNAIISALAAIG